MRFSLKRRTRDPNYLVVFRGPDGKPRERSTKERNIKRARDSAVVVIREAYSPPAPAIPPAKRPTWDEAVTQMVRHAQASKLRPNTIEQYEIAVRLLRNVFPDVEGPADVTPAMAKEFKARRLEAGKSARTVAGNIGNLSIVFGKWWKETCDIIPENPFSDVQPPELDKPAPRLITDQEQEQFLGWLTARWDGWRLPALFLDIKAAIGCRIGELAAARTADLRDGRIRFRAETTKGRKERSVRLPANLYAELTEVAGREFVFDAFSAELRRIHKDRGNPHNARSVRPFAPERLVDWLENEVQAYFDQRPEVPSFKLHNLRGTAMSRAKMLGISYDDASIAFGCHPETMREHYLSLDEVQIADRVMDRLHQSRPADKSRTPVEELGRNEGDSSAA